MQGTRGARHVTISTVLIPSPQRRGQNSKAGEKQKKESPAHWSRLPRIPPFSLSSSRDSFESRVGKRGKCRAITNDRLKNSLRYSKVTTRRSEHKKSAQPLDVGQAPKAHYARTPGGKAGVIRVTSLDGGLTTSPSKRLLIGPGLTFKGTDLR